MAIQTTNGQDAMIHIGVDMSGVSEGYDKAGKATANFTSQTERRLKALDKIKVSPAVEIKDKITAPLKKIQGGIDRFKSSLLSLKGALIGAGVLTGTTALFKQSLQLANDQEQALIGFQTMLGSAQKAQNMMSQLSTFAIQTPFEMSQLRDATSKLLAFGFSSNSIIPTLTAVGDAAAGLGKGSEGVDEITLALGQMRAKTKVSGDEMLQLVEAGVPAWDILSKGMHKSTTEIMKMSQNGLIPANKAIDILVKGMESRFPNMMAKQSRTLGGLFSTMKDFFSLNIFTSFGQGIADKIESPLGKLTDKLTGNTKQLNKMKDMFHAMGADVGTFVVNNFQKFYNWLDKLANNKNFQKMNLGDKIIYLIDKALDAINKYISNGKGSKKLEEIFTKVGEIAVKAWTKVITTTSSNTVKDLSKGNLIGAAGNAFIFTKLGGLTALIAGWKAVTKLYQGGKWTAKTVPKAASATKKFTTGENLWEAKIGNGKVMETKPSKVVRMSRVRTSKVPKIKVPEAPAETVVKESESATAELSKFAKVAGKIGKVGKVAGRIAVPLGMAADAYGVYKSKNKVKAAVGAAGGWTGAFAGGKLGAAIGTAIAPGIGTAIGGLIGGVGGYAAGSKIGKTVVSHFQKSKSKSKASGAASSNKAYLNNDVVKPFSDVVSRSTSWGRTLIKNFMKGRDSAGMSMGGWLNTKVYIPFRNIVVRSTSWGRNLIGNFISGMQARSGDLNNEVKTLTNKVINQFKSSLGIASPSKVTFGIGQYLMQGLINGMGAVDIQKFTKKQMSGLVGAMGGFSNKNVSGWLTTALALTGTSMSWLPGLMRLVQAESGGNPSAKNPSGATGLLQTKPGTFNAFALKGLGGITNPVANAAAAIRYIKARYGSVYNTPLFKGGKYVGYANGAIVNRPHLGLVGEGGSPEAIIPLNRSRRSLALYNEAGKQLGVNSSGRGSSRDININININGAPRGQVAYSGGNIEEIAHRAGEIAAQEIQAALENTA